MKTNTPRTAFALIALLILAGTVAFAQPGPGAGPNARVRPGTGMGCLGGCPGLDLAAVQTVTAKVVSFTGGAGEGAPTLNLAADGGDLAIVVGPYRLWAASGLSAEAGSLVTVTYAPCEASGAFVAVSITDAEGKTVQFRDPETGLPVGGKAGKPRWRGRG
jgi:hypothetical protein